MERSLLILHIILNYSGFSTSHFAMCQDPALLLFIKPEWMIRKYKHINK